MSSSRVGFHQQNEPPQGGPVENENADRMDNENDERSHGHNNDLAGSVPIPTISKTHLDADGGRGRDVLLERLLSMHGVYPKAYSSFDRQDCCELIAKSTKAILTSTCDDEFRKECFELLKVNSSQEVESTIITLLNQLPVVERKKIRRSKPQIDIEVIDVELEYLLQLQQRPTHGDGQQLELDECPKATPVTWINMDADDANSSKSQPLVSDVGVLDLEYLLQHRSPHAQEFEDGYDNPRTTTVNSIARNADNASSQNIPALILDVVESLHAQHIEDEYANPRTTAVNSIARNAGDASSPNIPALISGLANSLDPQQFELDKCAKPTTTAVPVNSIPMDVDDANSQSGRLLHLDSQGQSQSWSQKYGRSISRQHLLGLFREAASDLP